MIKKMVFQTLLICITIHVHGQEKHDYQWVLDRFMLIDFRQESVQLSVLNDTTGFDSGDYSTSICDESGELLFYSGGCYIINSQHEIMQNGDSINSSYAYLDFCNVGDFPMRLNNTVIPYPTSNQKYIYFNLDINVLDGMLPAPLHLYYHVIDMDLDDGWGAVVEKNQLVISDTLSRGYLQAVRHANAIDWWLIAPEWNSNCYFIIPITAEGVGLPQKQCLGGIWHDLDGGGQAVFSPDGTKYARIGGQVGLYLFDFDHEEGILSNPIVLPYPYEEEYFRGIAFSPGSKYLYVSAQFDLFQFDLEADDIQESLQLVGQLHPEEAFPGVGTLALQKLAPNGKIYIASPGAHQFLSVINRPDCPGMSCDFQPWVLELPKSNYAGLPNLPHFGIPESDTTCDSIVATNTLIEENSFKLFPNPATNKITIEAKQMQGKYRLLNTKGQIIREGMLQPSTTINISNLIEGIYFIQFLSEGGRNLGMEKMVVWRK